MDCEDEWNDAELTDETLVALLAALEGKALERKKVLLAANRLTCACLPSLSAFAHVKYLLLAHNRISELHGLPCWSTLTVLCLDDNRLVTLEGFPPLKNLEVLNLYNNLLESLQGLPLLPKLNWLELRNNPRLSKHLALCSDTEEQCKQVMAHWVRLRNCQAARCALYSLLRQNDVTRDLAPTISAMVWSTRSDGRWMWLH
jgi:hypothetical protein